MGRFFHHKNPNGLARYRIRHADRRALADIGMVTDNLLNLVGVDIEPTDENHVFLTINDMQIAVAIPGTNIACLKKAVRRKRSPCLLGRIPIPLHDLRALHDNLTLPQFDLRFGHR